MITWFSLDMFRFWNADETDFQTWIYFLRSYANRLINNNNWIIEAL